MTSCTKTMTNTTLMIQDSIRHYYPLVQGMDLTLYWRVANTGHEPLVLTDVQPSCGCIVETTDGNNVILPGKQQILKFIFKSSKYNGYVHHTIRLFGNIAPEGMASMSFDLEVVPSTSEYRDYEDIQRHLQDDSSTPAPELTTKDAMDRATRDYWTNAEDYPTGRHEDFWKQEP